MKSGVRMGISNAIYLCGLLMRISNAIYLCGLLIRISNGNHITFFPIINSNYSKIFKI